MAGVPFIRDGPIFRRLVDVDGNDRGFRGVAVRSGFGDGIGPDIRDAAEIDIDRVFAVGPFAKLLSVPAGNIAGVFLLLVIPFASESFIP